MGKSNNTDRAIILAAGKGARLNLLADIIPKY